MIALQWPKGKTRWQQSENVYTICIDKTTNNCEQKSLMMQSCNPEKNSCDTGQDWLHWIQNKFDKCQELWRKFDPTHFDLIMQAIMQVNSIFIMQVIMQVIKIICFLYIKATR